MDEVRRFEHRGTRVSWDVARSRLTLVYAEAELEARDAEAMMERITPWVDVARSFTVLVDARDLRSVPIGWRSAWMGWFRERRGRMKVAIFGATRIDALIIPLFALMSGADIRVFDDEPSAEKWLAAA